MWQGLRWDRGRDVLSSGCISQLHQAEHLKDSWGNTGSLGQAAEQMARGILLSPLFLYTSDEGWRSKSGCHLSSLLQNATRGFFVVSML